MARSFWRDGGVTVGNVQELWHGTRAGNLLSILRAGFTIPPANAPHVTGRMFGNGVYFSDQSTKSLNYRLRNGAASERRSCRRKATGARTCCSAMSRWAIRTPLTVLAADGRTRLRQHLRPKRVSAAF